MPIPELSPQRCLLAVNFWLLFFSFCVGAPQGPPALAQSSRQVLCKDCCGPVSLLILIDQVRLPSYKKSSCWQSFKCHSIAVQLKCGD